MNISIIKEDKTAYIDGIATHNVDLSFISDEIRAIHWDDVTNTKMI